MKILGDKLGMKFDHSILFIKYIKIYMKYGIKLYNWRNCKEFIENPDMYDYFDLKDKTMVEIGVQYGDYTAYFNKRYNTKIIGFDALIDTMSIRLENLMINKCKNVDIYNIVIGNGNNIKCFENFDMVINENMLIDKNMNYKNYEIKEFETEKLDELLKNKMSLSRKTNTDIIMTSQLLRSIDLKAVKFANLIINNCKDVNIYNIVIGNGNNIKCFKNFDMLNNENMLIDKNMNYKNYEIKEFKTEKLDELLKNEMSLKDFNIDIVKIDIEGNELYALEGMAEIINKYKPQFIIEVHSHKLFTDVYNFLNKFDYVIKSCKKLNNQIEILYMEVI